MTWDQETEERVDEALAIVRRGRQEDEALALVARGHRRRLRIADHHPWETPQFGPTPSTPSARQITRSALIVVSAVFMVLLLARAMESSGWAKIGYAALGVGILVLAAGLTDRRLDRP